MVKVWCARTRSLFFSRHAARSWLVSPSFQDRRDLGRAEEAAVSRDSFHRSNQPSSRLLPFRAPNLFF